jgi:hypothetical protein
MKLFRTKVWRWLDIGFLKWSSILIGMIAGAYLSEFVRQYVWVFALVALLLAVRPAVRYFGDDEGK